MYNVEIGKGAIFIIAVNFYAVKQSVEDDVLPFDLPFVNLFPEVPRVRFRIGGEEVRPREEIKLTLLTIHILGFFYRFLPRFRTKNLVPVPVNLFQIVGGDDEKSVSYLINVLSGILVVSFFAGSRCVAEIRSLHVVANVQVSLPHLFIPCFGEWKAPFVGVVSKN